jgi:cell division septum initiation protein DivIVA
MAKNPRAGVDIVVNEKPAQRGLQALQDSFTSTIVQMNAAMEVASKVFGAASAAIGAVVDAASEYVELAMEQERVERRAMAALQSRQTFTRVELDLLQQANAARQQQLGIGDEVQLQLQGTLASMGVAKGQIDAATRAAIGLSEAMGMGLEEAGKIAAKALTGNVDALKEYGINARSVGEAQTALNALYEQAVAQSTTLATRYQVLNANIGDLKEVLGQTITSSGVAKDALDALSAATVQLQTFFASSDGRELVNQFFSVITVGAADAIDAMIGAYRVMQALSGERERGSLLSRAGGAGRLAMSVTPSSLLARAMGLTPGGLQGQAAEMKDALDQLMGRGVEPLGDSPLVQTASDLADRLRAAAKSLVEIQSGLGGGAGGRRGGGGGGALPGVSVEVGDIRLSRDIQLEHAVQQAKQLRAGFAAELATNQAQLTREAADIQRQVDMDVLNQRNDLHRQAFELRMQTTREMTAQELEVIVAGGKAINEAQTQQMQVLGDVATSVANVVGSAVTELITAWASGADMADMTVGKFVGGIIKQLGTMAIQVGTAALLMAPLALIPGLGWLIGGPQNAPLVAAAGAALVVGGAGMVALGASMGGGSARGGATVPRAGGAAGAGGTQPRGFDVLPRGFGGMGRDMAAAPSYTVNVSFGVVGDERRAARMIRDVLERGR